MPFLNWLVPVRPRPAEPLAPGIYGFSREVDGVAVRAHLRVEPDGSGLLLLNACAVVRLSPSGVVIAHGLLNQESEDTIVNAVRSRFRGATKRAVLADTAHVRRLLDQLAHPDSAYPVLNLEDAAFSPHAAQLMAPFRADLPLGPPEQMQPLIARLWACGILHVGILAPPRPDAQQLVSAVERAEDTGMIAGVRIRAHDLSQGSLLRDLALAGVDHVTVPFLSSDADTHDALLGPGDHAAAVSALTELSAQEVCPVAECTLVQATLDGFERTVDALLALNVDTLSVFALAVPDDVPADQVHGAIGASGMPQTAALVEETAHAHGLRVLWQPPVLLHPERSLTEQVLAGPRCSGDAAVRVELDGSVVPPRGPWCSAGNVLHDAWETIWSHPAFRVYRERLQAPTHCDVCPGLAICAADCPREPAGWAAWKPTDASEVSQ